VCGKILRRKQQQLLSYARACVMSRLASYLTLRHTCEFGSTVLVCSSYGAQWIIDINYVHSPSNQPAHVIDSFREANPDLTSHVVDRHASLIDDSS
jgi:hypothetical protein